jgi:chemotaxis protein methyltransferase CheR
MAKTKYPEISEGRYIQLCNLIKQTLGLYFPHKKKDDLFRGMLEFSSKINAKNLDECIDYILSTKDSQQMCEKLASHLTVGETYFYRHSNQIDSIKRLILTNLFLERKRDSGEKRLRFWSSSCCTGEEPYTIAMMLNEIPYNFKDWDIRITGSDLNPIYLAKAKESKYGTWSFRGGGKSIIKKYFKTTPGKKYLLDPEIKSKVTFIYHNLVTEKYPSMCNGTNGLDFIFCRNTFIYFDNSTIKKVVKKLYNCLNDEGWLIVAPAETPLVSEMNLFETIKFGDVFLFNKKAKNAVKTTTMKSLKKPLLMQKLKMGTSKPLSFNLSMQNSRAKLDLGKLNSETQSRHSVTQSKNESTHIKSVNYNDVIPMLEKKYKNRQFVLPLSEETKNEIIILIKSYANVGKLKEADYWARTAITIDKLVPDFYYIHATILQELGEEKEMANTLRKVVYLDDKHIPAHFLFGLLKKKQNKKREAERYLNKALGLLKSAEPATIIKGTDDLTAGRLTSMINSTLKSIK